MIRERRYLFIAQFPLYQLVHEVVVGAGPGPDGLDVSPGCVEITVVVDKVGEDHGHRPAGPGYTVNQNLPTTLSLRKSHSPVPSDADKWLEAWTKYFSGAGPGAGARHRFCFLPPIIPVVIVD